VFRIRVSGGEAERIVDLKNWHLTGRYGLWMGLDPTDAPLLLRDEAWRSFCPFPPVRVVSWTHQTHDCSDQWRPRNPHSRCWNHFSGSPGAYSEHDQQRRLEDRMWSRSPVAAPTHTLRLKTRRTIRARSSFA